MKKMLKHGETALLQWHQSSSPRERVSSGTVVEAIDRLPKASIRGDINFCVTEQEIMRGPIIGRYRVETEDLQEPLFCLWCAQDGEVLNRNARSTDIAFDLSGERTSQCWMPVILDGSCTGQLWTSVVSVQVMGARDAHDSIVSGIFVQILVTGEDVLEEVA
jgi:hypothetical protein